MSEELSKVLIQLQMSKGNFHQAWRDISALDWDQHPQFKERRLSSREEELSIKIELFLKGGVSSEAVAQFIENDLKAINGIESQKIV